MTQDPANKTGKSESESGAEPDPLQEQQEKPKRPREIGGAKGLEPTRYGDWEHNGRCSDF